MGEKRLCALTNDVRSGKAAGGGRAGGRASSLASHSEPMNQNRAAKELRDNGENNLPSRLMN